jgi:hypothetical protein
VARGQKKAGLFSWAIFDRVVVAHGQKKARLFLDDF